MTNKQLAEQIRDLYNRHPRFPTVEEVEAVLNAKDMAFRWEVVCDNPQKDLLLKQVNEAVKNFGIINVLDAVAAIDYTQVKLVDSVSQQGVKNCADYLDRKASASGSARSPRLLP